MPARNRYGARRHPPSRPVLPVITIVCDDTKTAVAYFDLLKHEVKLRRTVFVFPAPHCGADGAAVLDYAKDKRPEPSEQNDKLFVILDLDTNRDIDVIRRHGAAEQIDVIASQPCYEVWTLAHLLDTGEAFQDCHAVLGRVRKKWRELFGDEFRPKAQADYSRLMSLRADAIARCRKRSKIDSQSWTEVWSVVEEVIKP